MVKQVKKIQLPEFYFSFQVFWLRLTGIELLEKNEGFLYRIYSTIVLLFAITYLVVECIELMYHSDFDTISIVGLCIINHSLTMIKVAVFYRSRKDIGNLMRSFHKGFYKPDKRRGGEFEEQCIDKVLRQSHFQISRYGGFVFIACSAGMVESLKSRFTESPGNWTLPYLPLSLVDTTHSPTFEFTCFYQGLAACTICLWIVLCDFAVISIIAQAGAQLRILEHCIRTYKSRSIAIKAQLSEERASGIVLRNTIKHHLSLLETVDEVEYLCRYLVLCVFLADMIVLCLSMYHASMKELLEYPLRLLSWSGQNPEQSKTKIFIGVGLHTVCGITLFVLNCIQLIYADGDISIISQNCEGLGTVIMVVGKFLITAIKTKDFRKMIKSTTELWSIKKFEKHDQKILNTFTQILKIERLFTHLIILNATSVVVACYFRKELPMGAWTWIDHQTLRTYTFILHAFFILCCTLINAGYDNLFLSFCTLLRTQFKMLHDSLEDLTVSTLISKSEEEIYFNKLRSYVQHHDFLLKYSKNLRDAYSPIMLVLYASLLMISVTEMYGILESKSFYLSVRHSIVLLSLIFQLAFYCIPLNYVTDEAISAAQGIYNSDWHSRYHPKLKSVVPLIIQRSQREIIFTAGGLIEMHCTTVLSLLRLSYSVCTIMRGLKNN